MLVAHSEVAVAVLAVGGDDDDAGGIDFVTFGVPTGLDHRKFNSACDIIGAVM